MQRTKQVKAMWKKETGSWRRWETAHQVHTKAKRDADGNIVEPSHEYTEKHAHRRRTAGSVSLREWARQQSDPMVVDWKKAKGIS